MVGDTGSIFLYEILTEIEVSRTINTTTNINDEKLQVTDDIYSDSDIDEGSNWDMEYSDFVVVNEEIPIFYEEEY